MKKNQGISVITLVITIIVIIIITSITVYNGIDLIESTNEKNAQDTLKIICSAIVKDESVLRFDSENTISLIGNDLKNALKAMNLEQYYDDSMEVNIRKNEKTEDEIKNVEYILNCVKNDKTYEYKYSYSLKNELTNYNVVFDSEKGVNRPLVLKDMNPLMMDGTTEVEDVYLDDWYSYEKKIGKFARVEYDEKIYVWIPRFAYKIQTFYEGQTYSEVPNTAIDILFINGKSNYMSNGERIPSDYIIHPAFSSNGTEYAGLWIEEVASENMNRLKNIKDISSGEESVNYNLHMMTNVECGAAIYLTFAYQLTNEIDFSKNEYVAAKRDGAELLDGEFITVYEENEEENMLHGDATKETPWHREWHEYPTSETPYIMRLFKSGLFDFKGTDGMSQAYSRTSIAIN